MVTPTITIEQNPFIDGPKKPPSWLVADNPLNYDAIQDVIRQRRPWCTRREIGRG